MQILWIELAKLEIRQDIIKIYQKINKAITHYKLIH